MNSRGLVWYVKYDNANKKKKVRQKKKNKDRCFVKPRIRLLLLLLYDLGQGQVSPRSTAKSGRSWIRSFNWCSFSNNNQLLLLKVSHKSNR